MEKLKIAFWIWGPFDDGVTYHDMDRRMKELKERGFNCVRMEAATGLFCKPDGTPRGPLKPHLQFGDFSKLSRQSDAYVHEREIDFKEHMLDIFKAASNNGVKIIPSSWYYLHTNYFFDEDINKELFDLPVDEKFSYFTDENIRLLTMLKENDLLDTVAYVELFNEFDGLYFTEDYGNREMTPEEYEHIRDIHEKSLERIKKAFPGILVGYNSYRPETTLELFPRNADVWNFHLYYMWGVYGVFQKGFVQRSFEDAEYPEEAKPFLGEKVSMADVVEACRGNLRTRWEWLRRHALYAAIDPEKVPEMEKFLENALVEQRAEITERFDDRLKKTIEFKEKNFPNIKMVMGEGVTYCASNIMLFEEHSRTYWEMIFEQAEKLKKAGLWGAVVRTTSGPEDPSWNLNVEDYQKANAIFAQEG